MIREHFHPHRGEILTDHGCCGGRRSGRYYRVIDVDVAGLDNFAPDAKGDVFLAAEPGQRVQDSCVSGA
jgi:hypothetical protein